MLKFLYRYFLLFSMGIKTRRRSMFFLYPVHIKTVSLEGSDTATELKMIKEYGFNQYNTVKSGLSCWIFFC